MADFDSMFAGARSTARAAGKKAEELLEVARLNMVVRDLKREVNHEFRQMGALLYKTRRQEGMEPVTEQEIEEFCLEVDGKRERLQEAELRMNTLRRRKVCAACTQSSPEKNEFCPRCGERLPEVGEVNAAAEDFDSQDFYEIDDEE